MIDIDQIAHTYESFFHFVKQRRPLPTFCVNDDVMYGCDTSFLDHNSFETVVVVDIIHTKDSTTTTTLVLYESIDTPNRFVL